MVDVSTFTLLFAKWIFYLQILEYFVSFVELLRKRKRIKMSTVLCYWVFPPWFNFWESPNQNLLYRCRLITTTFRNKNWYDCVIELCASNILTLSIFVHNHLNWKQSLTWYNTIKCSYFTNNPQCIGIFVIDFNIRILIIELHFRVKPLAVIMREIYL